MSLHSYLNDANTLKTSHQPIFYRLNEQVIAKEQFYSLLQSGKIAVFDDLYNQLKELIKSRNPDKKLTTTDYELLINGHLNGCPIDDYGVWVHYPWSHRIVHLLDEEEYIELRTSANRNKISTKERNILATKKVGVIGLSVGQSVSVTLALERGCGELRLADFDTLELNNLNRIRTGVHNLGILKVYAVAREIAEIDPFIKVICYEEGITDDNIDAFFTQGGKLDAVIDECDGVNIKILCRLKAKELHVPVLMEASDRGTLDIERFDLEPDRPIMHGWLQHLSLDLDVLRKLETNEQKLPYMLPIAGFDTLSNRMKASLLEMNRSITTWPQLATAVTLGGALTADTCRRMFLEQLTVSGRYFIDLEQLIPEPVTHPNKVVSLPAKRNLDEVIAAISTQTKKEVKGNANIKYLYPHSKTITDWLAIVLDVPSYANSQPWHWHYENGKLYLIILPPSLAYNDPANLNTYLSIGRAIEQISLVAADHHVSIETELITIIGQKIVCISFFETGLQNENDKIVRNKEKLDAKIEYRVENDISKELYDIAAREVGVSFQLISDTIEVTQITEIIAESERLNYLIPAAHEDIFKEIIRFPDSDAVTGITPTEMGFSPQDMFGMKIVANPDVATILSHWPNGGSALEAPYRQRLQSTKYFGVLAVENITENTMVQCGRTLQRMHSSISNSGLTTHLWQAPVIHNQQLDAHSNIIPAHVLSELIYINDRLKETLNSFGNKKIICIFQIKMGTTITKHALSKKMDDILTFADC